MNVFLLLLIVALCFGFALVNGMNDLSGMMATLIATRAASLGVAQLVAILGIWVGVMLGTDAVARTVAVGLIDLQRDGLSELTRLIVWLGAILASLSWVTLARRTGIPTSATHTFIGGLCGASLAGTRDASSVTWGFAELFRSLHVVGVAKVFVGLILSPLVGASLGFLLYRMIAVTLRRATPQVNETIRKLEVVTVFSQAFNYGLNDAHTVMGVLAGACIAGGAPYDAAGVFSIPLGIQLTVASALTIGAAIGSSSIIRTVGRGLFRVRPAEAFAGQVAASLSVFGASITGAPVSSSQVISSALVGVGGAWRPQHVRWQRVREILFAWVVTFPASLLLGGLFTLLLRLVLRA